MLFLANPESDITAELIYSDCYLVIPQFGILKRWKRQGLDHNYFVVHSSQYALGLHRWEKAYCLIFISRRECEIDFQQMKRIIGWFGRCFSAFYSFAIRIGFKWKFLYVFSNIKRNYKRGSYWWSLILHRAWVSIFWSIRSV